MAVVKSVWLRNASKTLGGAVAYMLKGQQVVRELAASISNPRTSAQMRQRIKLANVVAMYKANRKWMLRYAFESKKQTWSVFNAFVSANLDRNTVYLTKAQVEAGNCIVAPYKMTSGSLTSIETNKTATNTYVTNIALGSGYDLASLTVANLTSAVLNLNNWLAEGDQISLVVNYQQAASGVYTVTARAYELVLDSTNSDLVVDYLADSHLSLFEVDGVQYLGFGTGSADSYLGFCFILSRTESGTTRVSTQGMILNDTTLYDDFSSATQRAAAISSYGSSDEEPFLVSSEVATGNNSDTVTVSILSAALGSGSAVLVGNYLGALTPATAYSLTINMSAEPSSDPSTIQITTAAGITQAASSSSYSGRVISATFGSYQGSAESAVSAISVTIDGVEYTAQFATTASSDNDDNGLTE